MTSKLSLNGTDTPPLAWNDLMKSSGSNDADPLRLLEDLLQILMQYLRNHGDGTSPASGPSSYGNGGGGYGNSDSYDNGDCCSHGNHNGNNNTDNNNTNNNTDNNGGKLPANLGPVDPNPKSGVDEDFRQGRYGNCATVAVIKAGLDKFGEKGLLNAQKTADGYRVRLRNGDVVNVSQSDLDLARQKSDFQPAGSSKSVPLKDYLAYAVVAKQLQKAHGGSLSQAMDSLNNGQDPMVVAGYLGLKATVVSVQQAESDRGGAIVVDSNHAMEARDGRVDLWGDSVADADVPSRLWQYRQTLQKGFLLA